MTFKHFLELIEKIQEAKLPGEISQLKMTPPERKQLLMNQNLEYINPKISAVMMLIYNRKENAYLYLMQRNSYNGVHSAQVSLPGGKAELSDENLLATAIRETHEEFGIKKEHYQVIRPLTELYIPPSNFMVYPFLSIITIPTNLQPNIDEVSEIIELPLSFLLNEDSISIKKIATSYSENIEVPVFEFEGKTIWGATAMILSEFKDLLMSIKI